MNHFGYTQRVKHMMRIEIIDVLTGNDVDFGIPITIEGIKLFELRKLLLTQMGEIFADNV